ncbi:MULTISPECIES: YchJ family metal-binding protein [unclassified Streptomyces]|uniref:YchJ family protein n=1 Tax=unclassified Streptomyces TaxID=2593676 RepID=UPI0033186549
MSRRAARPQTTACPCGHPEPYEKCCGRLHRGEVAATVPEELMRSRYCAFAVKDEAYLLRTWHPRTRPPGVEFDPGLRWVGLEILDIADGTAFHTTGTVEFRARYTDGGRKESLHERSRFERLDGVWVYVDGAFID